MATLCTDLSGALQISLLACPKDRNLTAAEAQAADLPEAGATGELPYDLAADDKVCIRVRNTLSQCLRVTLLNSAACGKVQLLGDQIIDPKSFYVFWADNDLGVPFAMTPPAGATQGPRASTGSRRSERRPSARTSDTCVSTRRSQRSPTPLEAVSATGISATARRATLRRSSGRRPRPSYGRAAEHDRRRSVRFHHPSTEPSSEAPRLA